ncbi:MAG: Flp pilus assembly protein CpaB [Streptosporangiales bacterium]|nr:Flp pilus assembly protein CpaB [Streptosporangiales bacterium]MBO0890367.1 Flp pilus assembly protein CpaB [Acidothermales bacterium]
MAAKTSSSGRRRLLRDLRRAVSKHRRLLAATLAAAATALAVGAVRPEPPATTGVVTAVRDLTAGSHLSTRDVRVRQVPASAVPDGALAEARDAVGHVLAAPVRRGETLTDVRLVGESSARGYGPDRVGTPVRIADPGVASLLRPGSLVDVLAVPTAAGLDATGPARVIAARVRVVSLPGTTDTPDGSGTLVVVAATPEQAAALTRAAAGSRLSVTLQPG